MIGYNKRTGAIAAITVMLVVGLIFVGYRMVSKPTVTAPEISMKPTSEPSSTPTPTFVKSVVDEFIQNGIKTIRIMDITMQDYSGNDTPFFSGSSPEVVFFPPSIIPLTPEDMAQLPNRIKVVSKKTMKDIRFSIFPIKPGESTKVPLTIQLFDVPKEDVLFRFIAADGKQEKSVTIRYSEPVGYSVTSEEDPGIVKYISTINKGINMSHYLDPGYRYTYRLQFTHDMDQESVQQKLNSFRSDGWLQGVEWRWENGRLLVLTIDFKPQSLIYFSLSGIKTIEGNALHESKSIRIQPARAEALYRINLSDSSQIGLFSAWDHFTEVDVSPNEKYALAATMGDNEMNTVYAYTLIDISGSLIKTFGIDEVHLPTWTGDGNSLIYVTDKKVMMVDLRTGETKVIWAPSNEEITYRVVSLDVDAKLGYIVVGWGSFDENGTFTYDLYSLSNPGDNQPLRIPNAGSYSCYEGPCYAPGYRSVQNGEMYMETAYYEVNKASITAYQLNLKTGDKKEVAPKRSIQDDARMTRVYDLENGQSLWIQKQPDEKTERWLIFDPGTKKETPLMETSLGLFQSWWSQFFELGDGKFLIHKPEQNWQVVDTRSKKVTDYELIPKEVETVHKQGKHLYFFAADLR